MKVDKFLGHLLEREEITQTLLLFGQDAIYEGRYVEDMRMLLKIIPHYRFSWIDELMLYHRRHNSNNTNNLTETATALRYTIEETLKTWGDIYNPIFKYEGDYMILDHLVINNLSKNEG